MKMWPEVRLNVPPGTYKDGARAVMSGQTALMLKKVEEIPSMLSTCDIKS
jgi:hypothetical protein